MRGFILVLFASIPLFGGTTDIAVTCDGTSVEGGDIASCSLGTYWATGASAQASLMGMSVNASAWTVQPQWGVDAGSSSASASLNADYVLTVTGGSGDGYAQPDIQIGSGSYGGVGWGSASIWLGGCFVGSSGGGPPGACPVMSIPFVFGVPQMLTLSEFADAEAGPYFYGVPDVGGMAGLLGFSFSAYGQPLNGVTYTFVPANQTSVPEPASLPLTALACAALIAIARCRSR